MDDITSDPGAIDVSAIHAFLSTAYWSSGISRSIVEKALANSLCFAVLHQPETDRGGNTVDDRQLIGFARVVTDRATFAYLCDVYILEAHRGRGLARRLVRHILDHPDLQGLRRFLLATRDAHGLYAGLGFKPLGAPERMMEIHRPEVYRSA